MAPTTQVHEITAASRLNNVRYAIRDLACVADEVIAQGHKVLPLNVGDPLNFDFQTPPHIIEAVYRAMRDGKNGYAPSPGIPEALEAIRAATLNAAELMNWQDRVGSIEAGKYADFIAVEGDPLRDIAVLEQVKFVMKGGTVVKDALPR